jgi:hypothetical protein
MLAALLVALLVSLLAALLARRAENNYSTVIQSSIKAGNSNGNERHHLWLFKTVYKS